MKRVLRAKYEEAGHEAQCGAEKRTTRYFRIKGPPGSEGSLNLGSGHAFQKVFFICTSTPMHSWTPIMMKLFNPENL